MLKGKTPQLLTLITSKVTCLHAVQSVFVEPFSIKPVALCQLFDPRIRVVGSPIFNLEFAGS